MPDARAHCKTRAQPRGYRALWPNRILRASSSVERSAFHRPGTSTTRALPALDPTDARLVARQTLVDDAEQAIDLVRIAIDRVGGSSRARRGENDGACPAIGPSPLICQNNHSETATCSRGASPPKRPLLHARYCRIAPDSKTEIGAPPPVGIDDRGPTVVGRDRQKARLELLAASDGPCAGRTASRTPRAR
jgi:hypothetical protein